MHETRKESLLTFIFDVVGQGTYCFVTVPNTYIITF